MKKPLLSIVTVSYNAAEGIGKTIRSVARQSWTDFEYLFIDGASKDATVAEIESQREAFASRGIPYRVISEPDRGIYDAMNKAIARAEGQWVLMLNAGDLLAGDTVLEQVFRSPCAQVDVLYGHMVVAEESRGRMLYRKVPAKPLEFLAVGMPFCHQSAFVRRETLERHLFNTDYRIVADYDQFLRIQQDGGVFCPVDVYVSVFYNDGISMKNPLKTLREYDRVRENLGMVGNAGGVGRLLAHGKAALRNTAKKLLPGLLYSEARGWMPRFPEDL